MPEPLSVHQWWRAVERASSGVDPSPDHADAPAWFGALTRAALAQLSLDLSAARAELDATGDELPEDWKRVRTLLYARLDARSSREAQLVELARDLTAFAEARACEAATRARALHTVGVLGIRLNRFADAEDALTAALEEIEDDSPSRNWIIDGLGQVYFSQGAWEEARRTFHKVAALKEKASDSLGVAITMGHLAHMEMSLGKPEDAAYRLKTTLDSDLGKELAPLSALRLRTFLLQARLDLDDETGIASEVEAIDRLLEELEDVEHYLKGYAALARARASSRSGAVRETRSWLQQAGARLTLADQATLLRYWESATRARSTRCRRLVREYARAIRRGRCGHRRRDPLAPAPGAPRERVGGSVRHVRPARASVRPRGAVEQSALDRDGGPRVRGTRSPGIVSTCRRAVFGANRRGARAHNQRTRHDDLR